MYSNSIDEKFNFNNKNVGDSAIFLDDSKVLDSGEVKTNDWQAKKINNLELSNSYRRLSKKYGAEISPHKWLRVRECATYLEFRLYLESQERRLHSANFCKDRLCGICSWRRSLKTFSQMMAVMNVASRDHEFIFLTLTVKNVSSDNLDNQIKEMMKGFKRLTERKQFKQSIKGYFRALEVTYSRKRDDYHPHFHVVLAVSKGYFKSRKYLKKDDFIKLWREAMRLDYDPSVDVRKFKAATDAQLKKAVAEAAKYTVKDSDYLVKHKNGKLDLDRTDEVVKTLSQALAYKRLLGWGGILKEIHKMLDLDDAENGDLVYTGDEDIEGGLYIIEKYKWHVGFSNYVLVATDEPTEK